MKQILIRPVITEKSMDRVKNNQYTFEVGMESNKFEIKNVVQAEYKVNATQIKTMIRKGKVKSTGKKRIGKKQANHKFAIVTIKTGQKIEAFTQ